MLIKYIYIYILKGSISFSIKQRVEGNGRQQKQNSLRSQNRYGQGSVMLPPFRCQSMLAIYSISINVSV